MPKDEVFVTFQVKAIADVEDTTEAIEIDTEETIVQMNTVNA